MAVILDGKTLASRIRAKVKERVAALPARPILAVFLVGEDPASRLYVDLKQKACEEAGIAFERLAYPADASEDELVVKIGELNARPDVTGILVQLPLPSQDADKIVAAIDPKKDVDGFHPKNLDALQSGKPGLVPAVALGIVKLIDEAHAPLRGRWAAIVSSPLFAKPIEALLAELDVKTFVVNPDASDLAEKTKAADVLVVAAGRPGLVRADAVKPGAIVIDVGTTKVDGKLLGDVDFASVEPVAGFLTPVPGGVGPMTVAMLLNNVAKAARS
ncbi:bifunctional 5,10-methylenetetrahydrofolate dehydrogenase/5,10-methenyltetrahydrofolate cyclohydrolase [Patescibacteria group bacterium]|nr:MAG: bifunctional 5,10-methylenetetrahydrofolate dehydrogenase/5,10-methenyltetrahydrofolate cyclohydrolase [Patescibacteria group bacterium]